MRSFLVLPLVAMLAGLLGGPAEAGVICGRYQLVTDLLSKRYDEKAVASKVDRLLKSFKDLRSALTANGTA